MRHAQELTTNILWVVKSIHHKHIKLRSMSQLPQPHGGAYRGLVPVRNTLTQMLLQIPMLIDQTKFDVGLYVLLRPTTGASSFSYVHLSTVSIPFYF